MLIWIFGMFTVILGIIIPSTVHALTTTTVSVVTTVE